MIWSSDTTDKIRYSKATCSGRKFQNVTVCVTPQVARELDTAFNGTVDDDSLFQYARSICVAEYQSITYEGYVPRIIGFGELPSSDYSYNPTIDPSLDAFFTTVSFRFGHSMVGNIAWKVGKGKEKDTMKIPLRKLFWKPQVINATNLDDWFRGMHLHEVGPRVSCI